MVSNNFKAMEKTPVSSYKVRFSDCDPYGHLNNARYIDYFLNAREDHLKDQYDLDLKSFYQSGLGWVVGSHEIIYRKPAMYSEIVSISSSLLRATPDFLLVEMTMMDMEQKQLKSIIWTYFIPVNLKTGKKESPSPEFMEFAYSVEDIGVSIKEGLKGRMNEKSKMQRI